MFNIIRASLRAGRVTEPYPQQPGVEGSRGRPWIDMDRCDTIGACVRACPSGAITLEAGEGGQRRWQLDVARCVFCGLCEEACSKGAITMSGEFELATRSRDDLIVAVTHGPRVAGGSGLSPAPTVVDPGTIPMEGDGEEDAGYRLSRRLRSLLRRSLHIRHMAAGSDNSCDWEISALLNPVYDVQRLGIDFVASPRHADLLLVTGAVTRHLEPALRATYEAMPAPRLVVAAGDEACGGGVLQGSYAVAGGVDRCLPVDVYIPGDPPSPQALIYGLLVALDRLEPKMRRRELFATP